MQHKYQKGILVLLTLAMASGLSGFRPYRVSTASEIALGGYDPVVYYAEEKARMGDSRYALEFDGVTWYFVSSTTRALFQKHAEMFVPAYGGYCAVGVADRVEGFQGFAVDPRNFVLYRGRIYFFHSVAVQNEWKKDPAAFVRRADREWKQLLAENKISPLVQPGVAR